MGFGSSRFGWRETTGFGETGVQCHPTHSDYVDPDTARELQEQQTELVQLTGT